MWCLCMAASLLSDCSRAAVATIERPTAAGETSNHIRTEEDTMSGSERWIPAGNPNPPNLQ
ncbi:hypothetical protein CCH79_00020015, partial [Gambusia affinis]